MDVFLYNLGICLYRFAIQLASVFNKKAALWVRGRKGIWKKMESVQRGSERLVWFHVASLGEFEQGRPVMELLKQKEPDTKILLTFFSPSGYEIRKNYDLVEYIFYLPSDTPAHARRLLRIFRPEAAVFVKYEFWYHYLHQLKKQQVPVYLISAIFRAEQPFFKWWGRIYRNMLRCFTTLFVQDTASVDLLNSIGITRVELAGDTRFDRVKQIFGQAVEIEKIALFAGDSPVVVCGSTWPEDENIILDYVNIKGNACRWVIVPHEIGDSHIREILRKCKRSVMLFSDEHADPRDYEVMIVDRIGLLSSIYRYAGIAYIGGGFGNGIHNTLEAAVYGIPVVFGPRYRKFREAVELRETGGGFSINDAMEFSSLFDSFLENPAIVQAAGKEASRYVETHLGATELIVRELIK